MNRNIKIIIGTVVILYIISVGIQLAALISFRTKFAFQNYWSKNVYHVSIITQKN